jgi:serine phosphatase RsbU (regulator of sigma subunit)
VASALLLELLLVGIAFLFVTLFPSSVEQAELMTEQHTAHIYALQAAVQAHGDALNPRSTFQPGLPTSLVLPGTDSSETIPYTAARSTSSQSPEFALLIAPNGQIVASSYPALYPPSASAASLLPDQARHINSALAGKAEATAQGGILSIAQPVLIQENKTIGAIYMQTQSQPFNINGGIFSVAGLVLFSGLFWLVLLVPIGAVFGFLTTRGLVRRIKRLVTATGKFASGDYTQRVPTKKQDEIGQLERQFNTMAEQLVESIAQQKSLVEQHARQEERARIEQELRTAQRIQLSLLPKGQPELPGWRIATYYQAAREVGGDLYDFLPFEDGRLGLVIGDVTDKGMPAALVMASTRSMLRATAQATDSPGEVLARVNDLLYTEIPANMFVTCFYAILDPGSGRLRFANAGHDLPYCQRAGLAYELRATGMPLGLMPGMCYEEQEAMIDRNENILFYTDGLVEAHNAKRDMFGFKYLATLLKEDAESKDLVDLLLEKLASFTGPNWEQEDDITLVTLQRLSRDIRAVS